MESATEVAVTLKLLPLVDPAVNKPALETVPPVALHVTAVFGLPVTVAVNCCAPPGCRVTLAGETVTVTAGAACMVTAAVAVLLGSAAEVAVTAKLPEALPAV